MISSGFRILNFFHLKRKIKAFHLVYYLKDKGFCRVSLCSIRIRITGLPAVGSFFMGSAGHTKHCYLDAIKSRNTGDSLKPPLR